ncbi:hypothetical protein A2686_04380 [Candidatus Woesebacteria bacterium RIFCSPHIGHO2_01_FULL_38_10]|uniref:PIN domain-containing protein n=1 Tax=Candidatus Woesebacteria bacterium RIFCSPLOWO2_01_FULL_39_10b TaxID=1802517 RepID=A0A1F8BAZ5_9BACT|nr:MAG: hypothetical protein A2686_04380 [Candidatus Woesebacteria bacterium RIFCSPHIGHO2_01_FULL_38_10]OGM60849.1 MAG: hypothetical protein A2892_04305 [Candidatus Woesebacteria bacterium RIFCSPLOWO2_01_FULL_39_10b]
MKKIFLDTNIFLRVLVSDNKQAEESAVLLRKIESGRLIPYTSTIVLLETAFTLRSYYKIKNTQIIKDVEKILKLRNLTIIEKTDFRKSLEIHKKTKVKLPDCLIATQIPANTVLVTYDREFQKIPALLVKTPKEVLENLKN